MIADEDDHDGWCHTAYGFNIERSVIELDLRGTNYIYNQVSSRLDRHEVLCDNQSTSDVFVKKSFLRNI